MKNAFKYALYILGGLIFIMVDIMLIRMIYSMMGGTAIIIGLTVIALVIIMTLLMRNGVKILNKERQIVYAQMSRNYPFKYNTGKIFSGFAQALAFPWLVIPAVMFLAGGVYFFVLPPITVAVLVVEVLVGNYWTDIGWSKFKYWLMNIGIYILGIIVGKALNYIL